MEKNRVHYDYQDIEVRKHFKWLYLDYYPDFGWNLLEVIPAERKKKYLHMSFRRDYNIPGKDRLIHYQARFDNCIGEIRNLEISMWFSATVSAVIVGMIGFFFLIGAMGMLHSGGSLGFFLLIPALAAFLLAYPCYLAVFRAKQKQTERFIKERYEELFRIGMSASQILEQS